MNLDKELAKIAGDEQLDAAVDNLAKMAARFYGLLSASGVPKEQAGHIVGQWIRALTTTAGQA